MIKLSGSWVAMPTPFDNNGKIDFAAFELMIERQIAYGTSQLFVLGSAGEVTLLSLEEKKEIVRRVIRIANGRIPVFFGASSLTTEALASANSRSRSANIRTSSSCNCRFSRAGSVSRSTSVPAASAIPLNGPRLPSIPPRVGSPKTHHRPG